MLMCQYVLNKRTHDVCELYCGDFSTSHKLLIRTLGWFCFEANIRNCSLFCPVFKWWSHSFIGIRSVQLSHYISSVGVNHSWFYCTCRYRFSSISFFLPNFGVYLRRWCGCCCCLLVAAFCDRSRHIFLLFIRGIRSFLVSVVERR